MIFISLCVAFYIRSKFSVNRELQPVTTQKNIQNNTKGEDNKQQPAAIINEQLVNEIKLLLAENKQTTLLQAEKILQKIAGSFNAIQGAFYILNESKKPALLKFIAGYAFYTPDNKPLEFELGEGLIGQAAKDKKILNIDEAPFERTLVFSGLGKTVPKHLIICPVVKNETTAAVMEFAAFNPFSSVHENTLKEVAECLAVKI